MALTPDDIEVHRRTLRSLERQERRALADFQAAERHLRGLRQAITSQKTILHAAEKGDI